MEKEVMHKIKEDLCKSLDYYAQQGISNADDIETVKHILSGLEKIKVMEAMDSYRNSGYSQRMYHDGGNSYRRDSEGRFMDAPNGSNSYRSSSYGRDNGYYDAGGMQEKLQHMLGQTQDPRERDVIQRIMHQL